MFRSSLVARLLGAAALLAAVPIVAHGAGAGAADPPQSGSIVLASGVDGEGLGNVTDNSNGATIPAHPVRDHFPGAYAAIPGARLISDRFGADLGDGTWEQLRAYRAPGVGAAITAKPATTGTCKPDGSDESLCTDYGDSWRSSRTYHTSFELPAGTVATGLTLNVVVDNVAKVTLNAGTATETVVLSANCDSYQPCSADPPAGFNTNFRVGLTASVDGARIVAGRNTLDFEVNDWGSVTGIIYRVTVNYSRPAGCVAGANRSCSLTLATPASLPAGTARYCYAPTDGITRTLFIKTADSADLLPVTLAPNTWVDAPLPTDGIVRYPTSEDANAVADLVDPTLSRCPGAITGG